MIFKRTYDQTGRITCCLIIYTANEKIISEGHDYHENGENHSTKDSFHNFLFMLQLFTLHFPITRMAKLLYDSCFGKSPRTFAASEDKSTIISHQYIASETR